MLLIPRCILRQYSAFLPVALNLPGLVEAWRKKPPTWWHRLGDWLRGLVPDEFKIAPGQLLELGARIELQWKKAARAGDQQAEPAVREVLSWATEIEADLAEGTEQGQYVRNIAFRQELTAEDAVLLRCPSAPAAPLTAASTTAEVFFADAMLVQDVQGSVPGFSLSDYPPVLGKPSDARVRLRMPEEVAGRLASHPLLAGGWHPYCRVLARRQRVGDTTSDLELLLLWLRGHDCPNERIVGDLVREWEALLVDVHAELVRLEEAAPHIEAELAVLRLEKPELDKGEDEMISRKYRARFLDEETIRYFVDKARDFEQSSLANGLGFMAGLARWIEALRLSGHALEAERIGHVFGKQVTPIPEEDWRKRLHYLRPFEVVRLDVDAFDRLTRALWQ